MSHTSNDEAVELAGLRAWKRQAIIDAQRIKDEFEIILAERNAARAEAETLRGALANVLGYWDDVQGKLIPEAWPIPYRAQAEILEARALLGSPPAPTSEAAPEPKCATCGDGGKVWDGRVPVARPCPDCAAPHPSGSADPDSKERP